jgi:hypothetical protein
MAVKNKTTKKRKNATVNAVCFDGWEKMSGEEFHRVRQNAHMYFYENTPTKDYPKHILHWMKENKYSAKDIAAAKRAMGDVSMHGSMFIVILCMLSTSGCPDFNEAEANYWRDLPGTVGDLKPMSYHIKTKVNDLIKKGQTIKEETTETSKQVVSIQDRMYEQVQPLISEFEDYIDDWVWSEADPKGFDPYRRMIGYEPTIKAAHAKIIRSAFEGRLAEAREVVEWKDEDIREAYSHFTAKERKQNLSIYEKIDDACRMIIEKGKATRKTRKPKAVSNEKLVSKLRYKQSDSENSLVSINPTEIIGASELWVFNAKTRKLGRYIADEYHRTLTVKGSTIVGFDTVKSVQKTLRKPKDQLKGFAKTGKVALRKFLDGVNSKESTLNGRINAETLILKAL